MAVTVGGEQVDEQFDGDGKFDKSTVGAMVGVVGNYENGA